MPSKNDIFHFRRVVSRELLSEPFIYVFSSFRCTIAVFFCLFVRLLRSGTGRCRWGVLECVCSSRETSNSNDTGLLLLLLSACTSGIYFMMIVWFGVGARRCAWILLLYGNILNNHVNFSFQNKYAFGYRRWHWIHCYWLFFSIFFLLPHCECVRTLQSLRTRAHDWYSVLARTSERTSKYSE